MQTRKIPATIVTGFLGAGKTTLLRHLLTNAQGEALVIETSGLALPKPLVQAFQWPALRNVFTVDAVVTVVDAPAVAAGLFAEDPVAVDAQRRADDNLDHDSPLAELFEDQLATADLVVLHKTDGMDAADIARVEAIVRAETPAGVKLVHVQHGRIDASVLLGLERAVEDVIDDRKTHHDEEEDHDHDAFDSVSVTLEVTDRQQLLDALATLVQNHEIYRVKGFVALPGTAMRLVVQGVGQRFDSHFDRAWRATDVKATRLVLIGDHLDAEVLQRELQAALAPNTSAA